jgi:hypothetical protein
MTLRLLPLCLLLGACASDWKFVGAEENAALVEGAQIATFERGRGASHEHRTEVRAGGDDQSVTSVDRVMKYTRPLDTPEAAIAYSDLVRLLGVTDAGAVGVAVRPDPRLTGRGANGRYSRDDAAAWGIDFEPEAKPYAGGFEISRVVLLPPAEHPVLPHSPTPWKLVLVREVVFRDGTIRALDTKTLTNGQDAARFAGF